MRLIGSLLLHFFYVDLFDAKLSYSSSSKLEVLPCCWLFYPFSVLYFYAVMLDFRANTLGPHQFLSHSALVSWHFSQDLLLDKNTLLSLPPETERSLFFFLFSSWYSFLVLMKQLVYSILLYSLLISLHFVGISFQSLI